MTPAAQGGGTGGAAGSRGRDVGRSVTMETDVQGLASGDVTIQLATRGDSRLRRIAWASAPVLTFVALILLWGALVVSCADNLVRPLIMKNMAGVHPVITLLGVFAGLSLFGFIGIVVGPLLFAMVLETARMFYREQTESA